MIEYLGENETELENNLACLSGAQIGLNQEKNGGQKSYDTLPLRFYVKKILYLHESNDLRKHFV